MERSSPRSRMKLATVAALAAIAMPQHQPSNATLIDPHPHKPSSDEDAVIPDVHGHRGVWFGSSHGARNTHRGKRGKSGKDPHGRSRGTTGYYMRLASYAIPMFARGVNQARPKRQKRAGAIALARLPKYEAPK